MSINSSFYAEYANNIKNKWVKKLEDASKVDGFYYREAVERIEKIIKEMKDFHFTE